MELSYKNKDKENWFLISWTLTNKCNYRCAYCPKHLHDGSSGYPDWNVVKNFVENFKLDNKEICYRLSGGEPTYWKHFLDLAKLIKEQGHTFSFLTNASKDLKYFNEINQHTDGLIISYHYKYADINHIKNVIKILDCPIAVNLMMIPEKFSELENIADLLFQTKENVTVWPKVILDKDAVDGKLTNNVSEYSDSQQMVFKDWPYSRKLNDSKLHRGEILLDGKEVTANDLFLNNLNNFYGWNCWAGLHMINIDMWGDIYRADCQQGGKIGNLSNYNLPSNPIICQKSVCACLSDIYLKKKYENTSDRKS